MKKLAVAVTLALLFAACGGGAEEGMEDESGMAEESGMMADSSAMESGMGEEGGMMADSSAMEGEMGDAMAPDSGMAPPDTSAMGGG